jgi:hypothetical protein
MARICQNPIETAKESATLRIDWERPATSKILSWKGNLCILLTQDDGKGDSFDGFSG